MRGTMLLVSALTGIVVSLSGCTDFGVQPIPPVPDDVVDATGTIVEPSADYFLIKADPTLSKPQGWTFYPLNLPETFKIDSLRVRFSGKVEVLPNAQYLYTPLRISSIKRLLP
jgi:hypothetical protein